MHRLILLRHAKAAWPEGVADHRRPLAERGQDDASVAAGLFGDEIPVPDVVLCSPALRTRQTWDIAGAGLDPAPRLRFERVVYGATIDELIDLARDLPETAATALIVGHEPTMSRTTLALAGASSSGPAVDRVQRKFPTCGIAVLTLDGPWADLAPGNAALERFVVPRA